MMKSIFMERRWGIRILSVILVIGMMAGMAWTALAAYPSHTDYMYDGANVLSASLKETVKSTNDTLYSKVKVRISVCIVESLGGEAIHAYARNIFNEWKLGEGVLLVISTGDEDYYAVQSTKIDGVLTNEKLDSILKDFMEPDFAEGNVSRGIQKTINKLASFLKSELPAAEANSSQQEQPEKPKEENKTTFGSVILSLLQILGWTAVVLVAAFVIFFVAALFNDTAAELMNRLVFSRFTGKKAPSKNTPYYDERLYGRPQNNRGQGQRPPQQNGQRQGYNRYQQGGVRYDDEYYGARSNVRSGTRGSNSGTRSGAAQNSNRQTVRSNPQRPTQMRNPDYEATRMVTINTRNRNGGNR